MQPSELSAAFHQAWRAAVDVPGYNKKAFQYVEQFFLDSQLVKFEEPKGQLVVCYNSSDGCTYSCDVVVPVEYESAEAFIVEFEAAMQQAFKKNDYLLSFANHKWDVSCFFEDGKYFDPTVYTLNEWFKQNKKG